MRVGIFSIFALILSSCYVGEEIPPDQQVWEYAHPSSVNMNPEVLYDIDEGLKGESFGSIKGLIIIKEDKLVFENYYEGNRRSELRNIGSITFSVAVLALDLFIEQGHISGLDAPVFEYLPDYQNIFDADTVKKQITFRHIISHKMGLSWDEEARVVDDYGQMRSTDDWVYYILSKPRDTPEPGQRFALNSAGGIILAKVMQNLLKDTSLENFLNKNLFDKIGIQNYSWERSPNGILNTGNGLSLTTMDLTRLGYMMLLEGRWLEKRRIIDRDWIFDVSSAQTTFNDRFSYGYGWKVLTEDYKDELALGETSTYYVDGEVGQGLYIIPEYEMIVSIAAENFFTNSKNISFALFFYSLRSLQPAAVN